MDPQQQLKRNIQRQARRIKKAERERDTLLSETIYLGTVGLLFVVPIVAGAYLGHWLDVRGGHYSARWILPCLLLGIIVGAINVYLFVRNNRGD
jgi:ATP synthase protein I